MEAEQMKWDRMNDPNVLNVIATVARQMAAKNVGILNAEDLEMEGAIFVAGRENLQRLAYMQDYRLLHRALTQEIFNAFVRPLQRTGAFDSMRYDNDAVEEVMDEVDVDLSFPDAKGSYSAEMVESLLPAIWDESYCYGLPARKDSPDPDMPSGSKNKATSNNLSAYIADIKAAWIHADLTKRERRALFLAYYLDWTQREIAYNQEVDQAAIQRRIKRAVLKIASHLNGEAIVQITD